MSELKEAMKCPKSFCQHILSDLSFKGEEAFDSRGFVRKPRTLERNFVGLCPDHGEVWLAKPGHHITESRRMGTVDAVFFEIDADWQNIAFAVRNLDRKL